MKDHYERTCSSSLDSEKTISALTDPNLVASWLPILSDVKEVNPLQSYTAKLEDKVGPFKLRADLDISVKIYDTSIEIRAEGKDRQIGSRLVFGGLLEVSSFSQSDGKTQVTLHGDYEITGRAAQMGSSSIKKKANHLVESFTSSMESFLS